MAKVLVVEDDPITRAILREIITSCGHVVVDAPDGMRAWERLQEDANLRLLITDIRMPGIDGKELVHLVRSSKKLANLPVIITSGVVDMRQIAQLLHEGHAMFIAKPIDSQKLCACIHTCLGSSSAV